MGINSLVVVSDTHCGCQLALCPPVVTLDEGGEYHHSAFQAKIWAMWNEFWYEFVPEVTHGDPYAVVHNGDAIDGVHHQSTTQITHNIKDQVAIAVEVMKPIVDMCEGRYYHIRGTEAHVGKSAATEEGLAKALGAIPDKHQHARNDLWIEVGGGLIHLLHHIGSTGSLAYETTALMKEYTESLMEAARWERRPADILVRSHRHRYAEIAVPKKRNGKGRVIVTPAWQGKQMALDTKLPTPTGWTSIGDVGIGDELFDETGAVCRVVGVNPIDLQPKSYLVEFSNGQSARACADHLWLTRSASSGYSSVKNTEQIKRSLKYGKEHRNNHLVKMPGPLQLPNANLAIDPYLLGCWLGDGDSDGGRMTGRDDDLSFYADEFGKAGISTRACPQKKRTSRLSLHDLKPKLRSLGLLKNKHIPPQYLRSSALQRLSLLQGLMDTDGTYTERILIFTTTSEALRDGVCELLSTLGIKYRWTAKETGHSPAFNIRFGMPSDLMKVFRLPRKLRTCHATSDLKSAPKSRWVSITNVTEIDPVPMLCIKVDSPSGLFLFGETMLPTHNTPFVWKIPGARQSTPMFGGIIIRWAEDSETLFVREKVWTVDPSDTVRV